MRHIPANHRASLPNFNQTKIDLLITELEMGHTFIRVALTTQDDAARSRNRANARKAYDHAAMYAAQATLTIDEDVAIKSELSVLKSELKKLGEEGLG